VPLLYGSGTSSNLNDYLRPCGGDELLRQTGNQNCSTSRIRQQRRIGQARCGRIWPSALRLLRWIEAVPIVVDGMCARWLRSSVSVGEGQDLCRGVEYPELVADKEQGEPGQPAERADQCCYSGHRIGRRNRIHIYQARRSAIARTPREMPMGQSPAPALDGDWLRLLWCAYRPVCNSRIPAQLMKCLVRMPFRRWPDDPPGRLYAGCVTANGG